MHADGNTPDMPELIGELANRTESGYLFGDITASRAGNTAQFAWSGSAQGGAQGINSSAAYAQGNITDGAGRTGGVPGVAFASGFSLASRITRDCLPIAPERLITASEGNTILALDNQPALDVLLGDLMLDPNHPRQALSAMSQMLAGLINPGESGVRSIGNFHPGVPVRRLIGIDPVRRAVVIADTVQNGQRLAFC